ncbi:MAG: hypothetical protein FRX48_01251 [Lasallia pustulata]|uniref:Uncharacterized protein n=1 Tax=Lasallia pustulata TaxID=136370 RepID=A0A5M8PZH1_9LECA|nr:MAG: hypothetical protein FRX48_01251 [Lasallia pustulata]
MIRALESTMSEESAWRTTTFNWFDAITATADDRESQLQNSISPSASEWPLVNLAGCDRRLFSTIAKLGRLNLLSKGKSVSRCLNAVPNILPSTSPYSKFWPELRIINSSFSSWSLDATTPPPSFHFDPITSSDLNHIKLRHISEAFRYAALLYTKRLAYASFPSSAASFQYLPLQVLHHIEQLKPAVSLLWPFYITGIECVNEEHRELIRKRCLFVRRDAGFLIVTTVLEL